MVHSTRDRISATRFSFSGLRTASPAPSRQVAQTIHRPVGPAVKQHPPRATEDRYDGSLAQSHSTNTVPPLSQYKTTGTGKLADKAVWIDAVDEGDASNHFKWATAKARLPDLSATQTAQASSEDRHSFKAPGTGDADRDEQTSASVVALQDRHVRSPAHLRQNIPFSVDPQMPTNVAPQISASHHGQNHNTARLPPNATITASNEPILSDDDTQDTKSAIRKVEDDVDKSHAKICELRLYVSQLESQTKHLCSGINQQQREITRCRSEANSLREAAKEATKVHESFVAHTKALALSVNKKYANLEAAQAALGRSAASCPMPQATTGLEALKESSHELIHNARQSAEVIQGLRDRLKAIESAEANRADIEQQLACCSVKLELLQKACDDKDKRLDESNNRNEEIRQQLARDDTVKEELVAINTHLKEVPTKEVLSGLFSTNLEMQEKKVVESLERAHDASTNLLVMQKDLDTNLDFIERLATELGCNGSNDDLSHLDLYEQISFQTDLLRQRLADQDLQLRTAVYELNNLKAAAQQHEEALSSVQISKQDMAVSLQHLQTELALAKKEQQLWREKYTDIKRTQEDRQKEDQRLRDQITALSQSDRIAHALAEERSVQLKSVQQQNLVQNEELVQLKLSKANVERQRMEDQASAATDSALETQYRCALTDIEILKREKKQYEEVKVQYLQSADALDKELRIAQGQVKSNTETNARMLDECQKQSREKVQEAEKVKQNEYEQDIALLQGSVKQLKQKLEQRDKEIKKRDDTSTSERKASDLAASHAYKLLKVIQANGLQVPDGILDDDGRMILFDQPTPHRSSRSSSSQSLNRKGILKAQSGKRRLIDQDIDDDDDEEAETLGKTITKAEGAVKAGAKKARFTDLTRSSEDEAESQLKLISVGIEEVTDVPVKKSKGRRRTQNL